MHPSVEQFWWKQNVKSSILLLTSVAVVVLCSDSVGAENVVVNDCSLVVDDSGASVAFLTHVGAASVELMAANTKPKLQTQRFGSIHFPFVQFGWQSGWHSFSSTFRLYPLLHVHCCGSVHLPFVQFSQYGWQLKKKFKKTHIPTFFQ